MAPDDFEHKLCDHYVQAHIPLIIVYKSHHNLSQHKWGNVQTYVWQTAGNAKEETAWTSLHCFIQKGMVG